MNMPDPEKRAELDLPPVVSKQELPSIDQNLQPNIKQMGTERNPELLPAQGNGAPTQQGPAAQASPSATQATPATATQAGQQTAQVSATPQIADDIDLIEKEWVEKAKDIVNKTKGDPRVQNRELNRFKAQYIQKRFNRSMQVKDGA